METAIIGKILEMGGVVAMLLYGYFQVKKDHAKTQKQYEDFIEYVMSENKNRENEYLKTIDKLSDSLSVVNKMSDTLDEVKSDITKLKEESIKRSE